MGLLLFTYILKEGDLSALDYKAYIAIMEEKKAERDWKPVEIDCTEYELRVEHFGKSIFGLHIYSVKIITEPLSAYYVGQGKGLLKVVEDCYDTNNGLAFNVTCIENGDIDFQYFCSSVDKVEKLAWNHARTGKAWVKKVKEYLESEPKDSYKTNWFYRHLAAQRRRDGTGGGA